MKYAYILNWYAESFHYEILNDDLGVKFNIYNL